MNAAGSSQKLKLFIRGRAMSGAPIISGIIQLARPTNAGITAPNTITRPCMVVIWLKNAGSTICRPGWNNSARITIANEPPSRNMVKAEPQVQRADVLVVGGQHPAHQAFGGAVGVVGMTVVIDNGAHGLSPVNRWAGQAGALCPDRFLTCAIDRVICFPPVSAPALL